MNAPYNPDIPAQVKTGLTRATKIPWRYNPAADGVNHEFVPHPTWLAVCGRETRETWSNTKFIFDASWELRHAVNTYGVEFDHGDPAQSRMLDRGIDVVTRQLKRWREAEGQGERQTARQLMTGAKLALQAAFRLEDI